MQLNYVILMHLLSHLQHPLGILPKDENKTDNMIDIMELTQQYVPLIEKTKDVSMDCMNTTVQVNTALGHAVLFAGDQKTASQARSAQKARINALTPSKRLIGLIPIVSDWHTKVKLLDVSGCTAYCT